MLAWWPRPPAGVSAPASSDLRVIVSNAYLARTVERRASGLRLPSVEHVRVTSHPPGSLVVRLDLSLGPLSAPAALELSPVARHGRVQVRLISAEVAGISVPPELTGFVADAINRRITDLPGGGGRAIGVRVLPAGVEILADYP